MSCQTMKRQRKLKCILVSERSQSEKTTYNDSNHMAFWKRQNPQTMKRPDQWCQGAGGGANRQSTQDLYGSDTVRVKRDLSCGLRVVVTCQCRFTDCNRCTHPRVGCW